MEGRILLHGTKAFNGVDSYDELIPLQRVLDIHNHSEWEICASTKAIGPVGIIIYNWTPLAYYNRDACSKLVDGHREVSKLRMKYKCSEDTFFNEPCEFSHNEAIIKDVYIHSVWISEGYLWENEDDTNFIKLLQEISTKYNIMVVDDNYLQLGVLSKIAEWHRG